MTDDASATAGTDGELSDMAHRVGDDLSGLLQNEVDAAKTELSTSAKEGASGAGLVGGAAIAGAMSLLFGSVAVYRGLGNRFGRAKSAAIVALLYAGAAAAFSAKGGEQLTQAAKRLS